MVDIERTIILYNSLRPQYTEAFIEALGYAVQHIHENEENVESILGIAGELRRGNVKAASDLMMQLQTGIRTVQLSGYLGDNGSSQVTRMLLSNEYPADVCEIIARSLGAKSLADFQEHHSNVQMSDQL